MPTTRVTWISIPDKKRCETCEGLDNYQWVFEDTVLPPLLEHPKYGVVWNVEADVSSAHEFGAFSSINCRCQLEIEIDDSDLTETIDEAVGDSLALHEALGSCLRDVVRFANLLKGFG